MTTTAWTAPLADNETDNSSAESAQDKDRRKNWVIMASGRLSRTPKIRPCAHDGTGRCAEPMTKPIAKRLRKAPINAALLFENDKGIIEAAESAP